MTSAGVSSGPLVTPALTKRRSKRAGAEPVAEGLDLLGRVDVDVLDLQPPAGRVLQVVQRGAGVAADGRDDERAAVQVLGGDREPEAAGGADHEDGLRSSAAVMGAPFAAI